MKPLSHHTYGLLVAWALAALSGTARAHSWPEGTIRLAPDGAMVGKPGFDRAHVKDGTDDYLIPPNGREKVILPDDKLVRENKMKLTDASYTAEFPMLSVAPGDNVAIKYRENGHVSRADKSNPLKPINRGTVYLYGTTENDLTSMNLMDVHLTWTADGKGGDGKGKLLATRNYDDGQCHEPLPSDGDFEGIVGYRKQFVSKADTLLCQSDLKIPEDAPVGKILTVIWVWDWPDMNVQGVAVPPASYNATSGDVFVQIPEVYTGVVDFKIVDPCDASLGDVKGPTCASAKGNIAAAFDVNQAATTRGIASQIAEPFLVKIPQAGFDVPSATADPKNIPFGMLVGQKPSVFPLPADILSAQNNPGAAAPAPTAKPTSGSGGSGGGGGSGGNAAAGGAGEGDDLVVTVTSTVPQGMKTMTVTRQSAADNTSAPKIRAARGRRWSA
ncbi:hypothetical protein C8A05DRAFT_14174 [Staphylotrichum tortipilum]|uniref:DUF7492 domain-containing protein n=1 Tax=Staphylotrichum tortipilum TaxID=2831512 RepID=A0AAN6MP35_9PEZI|nr:hypothetical protein C8A05DRAFT_14174 [Staphylotrichum longicolle]